MATSSVPRVKGALLTIMASALGSVQTSWAHPNALILKESVFMGDARFESEVVAALRTSPRQQDETYTIPVYVDVLSEGNDPQAGEERMWVLVGLVETAIRNDQSLGGLTWTGGTLHYAQVNGKAPVNYITDSAWASACVIDVKCHARI